MTRSSKRSPIPKPPLPEVRRLTPEESEALRQDLKDSLVQLRKMMAERSDEEGELHEDVPPSEPAFDPKSLSEAERLQAFRNAHLLLEELQKAGVPLGPMPANKKPI